MRISLALFLAGTLVLAGCGGWRDSRVNPGNWFGKSKSVPVATEVAEETNPLIPERQGKSIFARKEAEDLSVLVAEISALRVEPTPTGAIIYATGVAERQGAHELQLRRLDDSPAGTLEYSFNVLYPEAQTATGSIHSRTVHAAVTLSEQDMAGIRLIRVNGATNARDTRRK
ncbi:hypothetical protein PH5382_01280 [Phaeobacter sp. CECT 5382]|uniref:hypothetical protein n=1 Tax=Rhodobacterales TaxID=204455 RepID=UPI0006D9F578|nr:hypothetical protein [Phaeobacter sp. CECT 5382]CUH87353.1 hypothetical protein PH5382_01280 [Phaeobacter sp. CECT 5382]